MDEDLAMAIRAYMRMVTSSFYDPNSTTNEGRYRLIDPKEFIKSSIRRWKEWAGVEAPPGISYIVGDLKKTKKKALQALRFDKNKITEDEAEEFWELIKDYPGFVKTWDWNKNA